MIRVGIVGIGAMGKGLVYQCMVTPGVQCTAITDVDEKRCQEVKGWLPVGSVVLLDGMAVAKYPFVDVLIDATGDIAGTLEVLKAAIRREKHIVMMNAEMDLAYGVELLELAKTFGVTYTSCGGDQPVVIKDLIDEIVFCGFEPVMAGNIKGFLDRYSNPTKIIPEADKRDLDYVQAAAMTDGTKMNIEMALVANCLGYKIPKVGMTGPRLDVVQDVFKAFDFGSIDAPCVEYIVGAEPNGGVFVVGKCDHPYQRKLLRYYKMGNGPYYLFYRHYHICHVEAMRSVIDAYNGKSSMQPDFGMRTDVYAYAKKPLMVGDTLDGLGGYACYGLIDNFKENGLPVLLCRGKKLRRAVGRDKEITKEDVE
jgi:predicted homoserine dehydrogenase-like protein